MKKERIYQEWQVSVRDRARTKFIPVFLVQAYSKVDAISQGARRLESSGVVVHDVNVDQEFVKDFERAKNRVDFKITGDDRYESIDEEIRKKSIGALTDLRLCPPPGRAFAVGEELHDGKKVLKVYPGGKFYECEWTQETHKPYSDEKMTIVRTFVFPWYELYPKNSFPKDAPVMGDEYLSRVSDSMQSGMETAWNTVLDWGVDFNPPYQRDDVWALEDQVKLIDSLMHSRPIGQFVFRRLTTKRAFATGFHYEIVDGKQRLRAIVDFYLGKFAWNGRYYHELNYQDVYTLRSNMFRYLVIKDDVPTAKVIEIFIQLNTTGKPMDPAIIEKAKQALEQAKAKGGS